MEQSVLATGQLRDFIGMVLDRVHYLDFWNCRLVCRVWRQESMKRQRHWFEWMWRHNANILKTVPLSTQVLQRAIRTVKKHRSATMKYQLGARKVAERTVVELRRKIHRTAAELEYLEQIDEKYPRVKRRRQIEMKISNPDEK